MPTLMIPTSDERCERLREQVTEDRYRVNEARIAEAILQRLLPVASR